MPRLSNDILTDAFQCIPGLENDDMRLVCRQWRNVVARNEPSLPLHNLYRVSLTSRSEAGPDDDANTTVFSAEAETDYTEGRNPPVQSIDKESTSLAALLPLLRNSFISIFEIDFEHLTAPMCLRLQEATAGVSVNWLDFGMTNCMAPAQTFHALVAGFRHVNDLSMASMRLTSACVSTSLLDACLKNGTTEISLPMTLPADNKTHYELNLRELIDYVFRQCEQLGCVYVGARRISGTEDAFGELSKIKDMPEKHSATLTLSGIGLSDTQKRKLTDMADEDAEPARKKRRVNQSSVDYLFKKSASKDICIMRRRILSKGLKRSMRNILS